MSPAEEECGKIIHAMTVALESCNQENQRLREKVKEWQHKYRKHER